MSKYHDDSTVASDPGGVRLSRQKLHHIWPREKGILGWLRRRFKNSSQIEEVFDEHLRLGDSRAAVVLSVDPLLIAAYTDELDCVAILHFPSELVRDNSLSLGSRLLTVNTYRRGRQVVKDLKLGSRNLERYVNFFPIIADFLSDDVARIESRKREISEDEWARCFEMGKTRVKELNGRVRDGSPYLSHIPV